MALSSLRRSNEHRFFISEAWREEDELSSVRFRERDSCVRFASFDCSDICDELSGPEDSPNAESTADETSEGTVDDPEK